MQVPVIRGVIDRRILVNYRIDPLILAQILPPPFEPKLVNGFGIAGICLIRLKEIRPKYFPGFFGLSSENAAHRIAVQWRTNGLLREGVYIPRRDTSSTLNTVIGGRLFPGIHHHANFDIDEQGPYYHVVISSNDNDLSLEVKAEIAQSLPESSIFNSIKEASEFFEAGSLGYSPARADEFDGLELRTFNWKVAPLSVSYVHSSFFEDGESFPKGSTEFDCALLMTDIEHEWHARDSICKNQAQIGRLSAF